MMQKSSEQPRRDENRAASESGHAIRSSLERQLEETRADAMKCAIPSIPDHVLLHRIGIGAYGEVWLARSTLGTLRAVKIVYRVRFEDDRPYEREFNGILKYEPFSRTHEGLVQVLHVGRNDEAGCFYYVMELADDSNAECGMRNAESNAADSTPHSALRIPHSYSPRTLRSEVARRQRLPPTDAAQLALRLAAGLAHLHAQGLVHRDIKPSNVIFVGGQPKLADIGLVTGAGDSRSFVGTEGFIPPEGPGTPQADIYGLGKLLYELATGRDRMDFPQLPPGVATIPEGEALLELNEVITRACAPDPQQRYATAVELQADLNLFLAGRSLREVRKVERHLVSLKRFAVAACVFLVLAVVAVWFAKIEERRAKEREQQSEERVRVESALRTRAEAAERGSRQQLYGALLEQARATVLSGELGQRVHALDAVRRAAAITNTAELRREAFAALALPDLRFERALPIGPEVTLVQLDPAFQRIALGREGGPVEIRATSDQRLLATLPASTSLWASGGLWSPDGRFLAVRREYGSGGPRADLEVWEVASAQRVLLLQNVPWGAMSFHPRLRRIMAGRTDGGITVWDLENGQEVTRFQLASLPMRLHFAPDGERFAAVYRTGADWMVSVHDSAAGRLLSSAYFGYQVTTIDWHPRGQWLAVPDYLGDVRLMDGETGNTRVLGRHKLGAETAMFSPDGDFLFSGGRENELICWDLRSLQRAFTIGLQSSRLQFHRDGRECAVLTPNGVQWHAFERPANLRELNADTLERLHRGTFSSDGRWLAVGGGKCIGVWDWSSDATPALTDVARFATPFFKPDGSELFAWWNNGDGGRNNGVGRWRLASTTNAAAPIQLDPLPVKTARRVYSALLCSNELVLTGESSVEFVALTNLAVGNGRFYNTTLPFGTVSADGRWLVLRNGWEPTFEVHRLPEMEKRLTVATGEDVMDFAFTPQSDELAVATRAGVEFYDPATWQRTRVLPVPMDRYASLLYAPDGKTFWATANNRTATLHDRRTLAVLLPLPTGVLPLAYSPDGRHLAVSAESRRLQVWDLTELRERFRELGVDWVANR